jgi:hypothetical protein
MADVCDKTKKITLPTATKLTMADVCDIRLKRHDLHKIRLTINKAGNV